MSEIVAGHPAAPIAAEINAREARRLREAVRQHRDQRGDDRCWLDDQVLYEAAGLGGTEFGETALPPKCDFLASCERYWLNRQGPREHGKGRLPDDMTIAELTAEARRLRGLVAELAGAGEGMLRSWGTQDEDEVVASRDAMAAALAKAKGVTA